MKKNIAFLIHTLSMGGAEKLTLDLSEYLSNYFNVTVIVLTNKIELLLPKNIAVYTLRRKSFLNFRELIRIVKKKNIHVVFSVMEKANFYSSILYRFTKTPTYVYSIHSPPSSFKRRKMIKRLLISFTYKIMLKKNSNIIGVSNGMKQELINKYNFSNITSIHNPINLTNIHKLKEEKIGFKIQGKPIYINVSRLVKLKGHYELILAFAKFFKSNPNSKLLILGDGPEKERLKELILRKDLSKSVLLLGQVLNPYPYYNISDFYICSSHYEGFGLTLLEAMSCGCIVASLDCNYGPREILRKGEEAFGFLGSIGEDNINTLIKLFENTVSCSTLVTEFSFKLERRVNDFSLKTVGQKYKRYLNEI